MINRCLSHLPISILFTTGQVGGTKLMNLDSREQLTRKTQDVFQQIHKKVYTLAAYHTRGHLQLSLIGLFLLGFSHQGKKRWI